ncbi:MAG: hypothetical protein R2831_13525 [Chitinophagaceae bacterium]
MPESATETTIPHDGNPRGGNPLAMLSQLLIDGEFEAARQCFGEVMATSPDHFETCRTAIEAAQDDAGRDAVRGLVDSAGEADPSDELRFRVTGCLLARYGTDEQLLEFLANWAVDSLHPLLRKSVLTDLLRWARYRVVESWISQSLEGPAFAEDLCVSYLRAVQLGHGTERYRKERDRLFAGLDASTRQRLLRAMPPGLCRPHEVIEQLQAAVEVGREHELSNLARKFLFYRDESVDRELHARPLPGTDLFVRYLNVAAHTRVAEAVDPCPEPQAEWTKRSQQAESGLTRGLARQRAAITSEPGRQNLKRAIQCTDLIRSHCGSTLLETSVLEGQAATLAAWLNGRIRGRKPTSFIRLGDGEGAFLPYPAALADSQVRDRLGHQRDWWGGCGFSAIRSEEAAELLVDAIRHADCLGIPPYSRCLHALGEEDVPTTPNQRGVLAVLDHVSGLPEPTLANKLITSAHAHMDMFEQNLYRDVFRGVDAVQVIGCHDLSRVLRTTIGVEVAKWYATPPEYKFRQMFGLSRSADSPGDYVRQFDTVAREVRIEPAPVFLVAAGFMGKLLCHRVRSQGGIAIDIGCVGDYWSSKPTRIQPLPERPFPRATDAETRGT